MKKQFLTLSVLALVFTSCSDDDGNAVLEDPTVEVPQTYSFERDGTSTVSYGGQTTRIMMGNVSLTQHLKNNTLSESELLNMYAHQEGNDDFF